MRSVISVFTVLIAGIVLFPTAARAQRDYFTPEEVEMIREAQQIDLRTNLLIKIIDRRFAGLNIDVGGTKLSAKDAEKWGQLPTARTDLLIDIKRILQKAIDDIDSLSERPDSMVIEPTDPKDKDKKPKGFSDLFPKAVRSLAAAATRWKTPLTTALASETGERDRGSILDSIEMCDEIIASVTKLPAEVKKPKN